MDYIFFYGHNDENGYLSNFSRQPFIENKQIFDTVERYMHYKKALLFNDTEIADNIIKSKTPYDAKQLGRKVKNFDNKLWDDNKVNIVKTGIRLKFEQNFVISQMLVATGQKHLVEASNSDRIWGIGYSSKNALQNLNSWGQNLLGKILMDIRSELIPR